MCATVFGASLGYVSITNVPLFAVSNTMSGPAPGDGFGAGAAAPRAAGVAVPLCCSRASAHDPTNSITAHAAIIRFMLVSSARQFLDIRRRSRNPRSVDEWAGRHADPRSRGTG